MSVHAIYALAAPAGPLSCFRIGRRVLFSERDVMEFLNECRCTKIEKKVVSCLSSTVVYPAIESALERSFRKLGVEPKLKNSTSKNAPGSTRRS
ncbi:hypothetical protein [Pandoraea horticolens]|uniref:hypothetical protein n=1 Tax=Pandoraea horticolens TaxID=2508298 RepID=UPI003CCCA41B